MASALFVGLLHTLAPGHWLPVVLLAKTHRWSLRTAFLGALTAGSGHILVSVGIGLVSIFIGAQFFSSYEEEIERLGGLMLAMFGLGYAFVSYFRHSSCLDHSHHGPDPAQKPESKNAPFLFLFSLGFSPCVAVVPLIATAGASGVIPTLATALGFSVGVLISLVTATSLSTAGLMKLDHPLFEHYGNVIAGLGIAIMGVIMFFISH